MFLGLASALTPLLVTVTLDRSANGLWTLFTVCALGIAALMTASGRVLPSPQPVKTT
jgi:hypothetical protein